MRRAHGVDKTQAAIVRVLRKVGASVWDTSAVGGDAPDLVVGFGGITYLHVSKRNVFAMLDWLHEQQANPLKNLFRKQEVFYDPNRSHNVGL